MTAYAMWQLRCDAEELDPEARGCVETNDASGENASHAREYARDEGWTRRRGPNGKMLDLCAKHSRPKEEWDAEG